MIDIPIYKLSPVTTTQVDALSNIGIVTINDLLHHFPRKYIDTRNPVLLSAWNSIDLQLSLVKILDNSVFRTRFGKIIVTTKFEDDDGNKAECMWFGQSFMSKIFEKDKYFLIFGKLASENTGSKLKINVTEYEEVYDGKNARHLDRIMPVYPETKGVTSKLFRSKLLLTKKYISSNLKSSNKWGFTDNIPTNIRYKYNLIEKNEAFEYIHFPETFEQIEKAKYRLAFDEIYEVMKKVELQKLEIIKQRSVPLKLKLELPTPDFDDITFKEFLFNLKNVLNISFELTPGQINVIKEISRDMSKMQPMHRLLQGDVGSGKTIVAGISSMIALNNKYDVVLLCPTTILANQHYNSLTKLFEKSGYEVVLVTGSSSNTQPESNYPIRNKLYVGTHSLLYKKETVFEKVGLVIIDEQHRFGVEQREQLVNLTNKKYKPHYLMLTATPIPRSIAQVYFADLDISVLNTIPNGRLKIDTYLVPENKRLDMHNWISKHIDEGGQVYFVCPLVNTSEKLQLKNVKEEFKNLCEIYDKKYKVELLHGELKDTTKQQILDRFKNNKIQILVSTQVIEVGIDVPNANIIVIESAERFGLAQLHQLRGRVGRGSRKSYCLLFETPKDEREESFDIGKENERLLYFAKTNNGMELAEYDMAIRGTGDMLGNSQSGFPKFKFASLSDIDMIKLVKLILKEI